MSSFLAACAAESEDDASEIPELGPPASIEDVLKPVRHRLVREHTAFLGENVWATDYTGRLFVSADSGYSWTHVPLPASGAIKTFEVAKNGLAAVIVTEAGVMMRTDDGADNWTQVDLVELVGPGVDTEWGGNYYSFTFDDELREGLWVDFCQVFRTDDGGRSWTRHADSLQESGNDIYCASKVLRDADTGVMFADVTVSGRILTSGSYLFRSDDDGETWSEICSLDEVGMIIERIQSCFKLDDLPPVLDEWLDDVLPRDLEALGAFSEQTAQGVFVERHLPLPPQVMAAPEWSGITEDLTSDRLWFGEDDKLAYTDDRGDTWHVVSSGMPDIDRVDFSLGEDLGFSIYGYEYLAVTGDVGRTWTAVNKQPLSIYDLAVLPDAKRVLVAAASGISLVDAETLEWRNVVKLDGVEHLVTAGTVAWAFSGEEGIFRSLDAGSTWQELPNTGESQYFSVEQAVCNENNCVLVGYAEDKALAHLTAEPFTFEVVELSRELPDFDDDYIAGIVFDNDLQRGWLAYEGGRLFGTGDGGRSWTKLADLKNEIETVSKARDTDHVIARGYSNRYLWSEDGKAFERIRAPLPADAYLYDICWLQDSVVLATAYDDESSDDFVLASRDGGHTWSEGTSTVLGEECVIPGGLVMLFGQIAALQD